MNITADLKKITFVLDDRGFKISWCQAPFSRQRDKADVSRALADFQKKEILEPYNGSRYRITPKLTPLGRTIAAQIRERAAVALDLASQGITDEMRENMYHCLDLISANMREICEGGLMDQ